MVVLGAWFPAIWLQILPKHAKALGRLAEGIYRLKGYTELNHAALRGLPEKF